MGCCAEELKVVNGTLVVNVSATILVGDANNLVDRRKYVLRYIIRWDGAIGSEVLIIETSNGTTFPVLTPTGNPVTIGRVRRRELLHLVFSNITNATAGVTPHFTLFNDIFPQELIVNNVAGGEVV